MTATTTALATFTPPAAAVPDGVTMLRAWASAASEAAQLVAPLVDTPFVPDAFRPKVDPRASAEEKQAAREVAIASATAAVLYGAGLGLDPMTSLQNIYVVGGRPGLYAAAMVALAQAHGHDVQTEDLTDSRAVVRARRRGTDHWERVTFTLDQAKKAGYTRNGKYQSDPQAMLWARAASIAIRRIAQDTLKGIAAVEELQDDDARSAAPAATTRVQRSPQPAALPAAVPEAPPLPGEIVPPVEDGDSIDERDWRKINERFVALGVTGPGQQADRLYVLSRITERAIARGGELTRPEGRLVLDTLTGTTRDRIRALLDERNQSPAAEPAGPPLPGEDDVDAGDADPDSDGDAAEDGQPTLPGDDPWDEQ